MQSAQILDFHEYRRRQALRDCGVASQRRQFLWVCPLDGRVWVGEFRPARPSTVAQWRRDGHTG